MNINKLMGLFSAIALVVVMMTSPVLAKNADDHVFNALNNKGDALVFPAYFAADGLTTNLTVINTDASHAVVAKVVVRSFAYSTELLDFFIFLTPNDVWKGDIRYVNGRVVVHSEDSSVWNPANSLCASAQVPFEYPLAPVRCPTYDSSSYGYVEVFEAAAVDWITPDEHHCLDLHDDYFGGIIPVGNTLDCLAGFGEYVFPGAAYTVFPATVLANYNVLNRLTTGQETFFGGDANNTLAEVEAALAKDDLVMPYYNGNDITLAMLTFPTKLTTVDSSCAIVSVRSPFFNQNGTISANAIMAPFSYDAYDDSENAIRECQVSPCVTGAFLPWELNLLVPNDLGISFGAGWSRISFGTTTEGADKDGNDITYQGAPVIGMVVHLTANGLSVGNIAYDYGVVDDETTGAYQKGCAAGAVVCPVCDADHLCLCETAATCEAAGGHFCNGACQTEVCGDVCDEDHLDLCATEDACEAAGGHFCNGACQAAECGAGCDETHLDLCTNETACEAVGGNWCDTFCQAAACPIPTCGPAHPNLCTTQAACEGAGLNWCEGTTCQVAACGTGPSTTICGVTVTCNTSCIGIGAPNCIEECGNWQVANCP